MEQEFIQVRELISVKYYGIQIRLFVIEVSGADSDDRFRYVVTIRTINHRDELTEFFTVAETAFSQFKKYVKKLAFTV